MARPARQHEWGDHTLALQLPSVSLTLSGLSTLQQRSLGVGYSDFLAREPALPAAPASLHCGAYRLDHYPAVDSDTLTRDQQYAPLARRHGNSLELVGCNFHARLPLCAAAPPGALGVLNEEELAQPNVIENVLRVLSAHTALRLGGVILHSAGLVFDGRAYVFVGRSNVGKTTLTRKAHRCGARVLSDDINLVLPHAGGYRAHAVPFTGEFGRTLCHSGSLDPVPVAALILLEQGATLQALPIGPASAVARLLVGCPFVNTDRAVSALLLQTLSELAAGLPVFRLQARRDDGMGAVMASVRSYMANE